MIRRISVFAAGVLVVLSAGNVVFGAWNLVDPSGTIALGSSQSASGQGDAGATYTVKCLSSGGVVIGACGGMIDFTQAFQCNMQLSGDAQYAGAGTAKLYQVTMGGNVEKDSNNVTYQ